MTKHTKVLDSFLSVNDNTNGFVGIDTVISAVGRPAILLQIPLIKLAAASDSVKWFLPSEYGTDIKYGPASANEKPHQLKLKVRAYLEEDEAIRQSGLKYTYVVTGPYPESYMDFNSSAREAGGWDFDTKTTYLLEKNNRVSFTSQKEYVHVFSVLLLFRDFFFFISNLSCTYSTGDLVLATLRHPAASFNKALKVNSFTTTPAEFHAEIERQTGGPWTVHDTSLARLREIEQEAWAAGIPAAAVVTLRRIWSDGGTLYDHRDNGVIGEPRVMTLKETVANHLKRRA